MGSTGGANITVDGLVFGYDTGYPLVSGSSDTYKFNKGEPTTNLVPDNDTKDFEGGGDGSWNYQTVAGSGSISTENPKTGTYSAKLTRIGSGGEVNYWWNAGPGLSLTPGYTYTFSMDVWCDKPGMARLFSYLAGTNGSSDYHPGDSNWHRLSMQFIPAESTSAAQLRFGISTSNSNYPVTAYFDNTQVELKSHPTPFTPGTRSVSGSLIDLTRTFDINLSNVSFDSNAQMTFDGTDDHARVDTNNTLGTFSDWSVDAWIRYETDESTNWMIIVDQAKYSKYYKNIMVWLHNSSNAKKIAMYDGSWQYSNSTIPPDTWTHIAATTEGQVAKMYINGELDATRTYSWNLTDNVTNFLGIGGTSNNPSYRMNGNIAVVKIYNKTLSDSEVLQNYNATKPRFSL